MRFHVVIPARYASTRLPGKPLLDIAGRTMIQRVVERACASRADEVLVATDDARIAAAVHDPRRPTETIAVMTDPDLPSGRDRVAAVAEARGWSDETLVVNVLGDEPFVALGGAPGVLSARFGGPGKTDADRYSLLLDKLIGIPPERRTARFRCAVAIAEPAGGVYFAEGTCEGRITSSPRGAHGFGYDPVFEVPTLGRTLAEVGPDAKNRVSHRAQAMRAAREILARLLSSHSAED